MNVDAAALDWADNKFYGHDYDDPDVNSRIALAVGAYKAGFAAGIEEARNILRNEFGGEW